MGKQLYSEITELGVVCGVFWAGVNRFRIFFCCDCYYVLCDTTHEVVYAHELYICVQGFMDAVRARLGGAAM